MYNDKAIAETCAGECAIVSLVHYEGMGFVVHGTCRSFWAPAITKTDANICIRYVREGWACLVIYLNAFVRCHSCSHPVWVCWTFRAPVTEAFPCVLWPAFHTLGVVSDFPRGCFRVLDRDNACDSRSTPFLNIHWYGDHPWPILPIWCHYLQDVRQDWANWQPSTTCQRLDFTLITWMIPRGVGTAVDKWSRVSALNLRLVMSFSGCSTLNSRTAGGM
jgi:hypothetical protein